MLRIPHGWIYYLAPEIVKEMSPAVDEDQLPFSKAADVYAFGYSVSRLLMQFRRCPLGGSVSPLSALVHSIHSDLLRQQEVLHRFKSVFSTVWYELQMGDWPLASQPVEAKIWLLGSSEGIRKVLAAANLGKEITVSRSGLRCAASPWG